MLQLNVQSICIKTFENLLKKFNKVVKTVKIKFEN